MNGQTERSPNIGIFDSGVGGLTIFSALRETLAGASYVFCSDNRNYPYGTKPIEAVIEHTCSVTNQLIARYALDILIVACNTASTVALNALRSSVKIPVIGTVPAIKPAAAITKTGTIGLLATEATVKRSYTDDLIRQFALDCRVIRVGSSRLVDLAEDKVRGEQISVSMVGEEIQPLFSQSSKIASERLDCVVLGCTHFPLLTEELHEAAPWPVAWIDSGYAIAERTAGIAVENGFSVTHQGLPRSPIGVLTARGAESDRLIPALVRLGFNRVDYMESIPAA